MRSKEIIGNLFVLISMVILWSFWGCGGDHLPNLQASNLQTDVLVFGSLYNADEGQFVKDASIQVLPGFTETTTDNDGNFFLETIGRGEYQIRATKGNLIASSFINTRTTDVVSVDLTFGTTARNQRNISFKDNLTYFTKKVEDDRSSDFYEELIVNAPRGFLQILTMDWSPINANEILFAAQELGRQPGIYRFNLESADFAELVVSTSTASINPTYSPNGRRFSYLQGDEIFIADVSNGGNARKLIRDASLIFLNVDDGSVVLNIQQRNEVINSQVGQGTVPERLPNVPPTPVERVNLGLASSSAIVAAQFRSQLNRYYNRFCFNNFGGMQACLNQFDRYCDGSLAWIPNPVTQGGSTETTSTFTDCQMVFLQADVPNGSYFDALNMPAACSVTMRDPVWSRTGNLISFQAKPKGCTAQRPRVCGRSCNDTDYDVFVAPADAEFTALDFDARIARAGEPEKLDKFSVIQVTNNTVEESNLGWDPGSGAIIFDQSNTPVGAAAALHYLVLANPTLMGYRSYTLLRNSNRAYQADFSASGKEILFVDTRITNENPDGFSQLFLGDWTGIIRNERQITKFSTARNIQFPRFYKIRPRAF